MPPSDEGGGFRQRRKTEREKGSSVTGSRRLLTSRLSLSHFLAKMPAPFCRLRRHFPRQAGESTLIRGSLSGDNRHAICAPTTIATAGRHHNICEANISLPEGQYHFCRKAKISLRRSRNITAPAAQAPMREAHAIRRSVYHLLCRYHIRRIYHPRHRSGYQCIKPKRLNTLPPSSPLRSRGRT